MFNKNSTLPKVWAEAIRKGERSIEEVPILSNLRVVVNIILEGGE